MLKTFGAIAIAASLITGPTLAQGTAPTPQENKISAPAPKAKAAVHHAGNPIAHKHLTKKHVAKKHIVKKHSAKKHYTKTHTKQVKQIKAAI